MARTEGGINNLNSDDPVLNRQMFAKTSNQGAPTLEEETIKVDTPPEVKAANEVTKEDIEKVEPVSQPPSVTTTVSTQTQPVLTNQEKLSMFLLPMAAELLNARTPGGMSNFTSFLQAAGRGLARVPQQIMAIKQLEAKGLDTKVPTRKQVKFTKPFNFNNKLYSLDDVAMLTDKEINLISQVDPTALSIVPKPSKTGLKELSRSAIYMTPEEAQATFPNNPKVQSLVSTSDSGLVGSPVMKNNRAVILKERYEGNQLIDIIPSFASKQPVGKKDTQLSIARYQSDLESAVNFLKENGADENTLGFNRIAEKLVNPDKAGQIVYEGGVAQRLSGTEADRAGSPLTRLILDPVKEMKNPSAVATQEYVKKLADQLQDAQTSYDELGPRVNTILQILPDTKTGVVEAGLLPFRRIFLNILGASAKDREDVSNLELLKQSSDAIAPLMRKAGAGSTSDMEFDAYRNAALNIKNTNMANFVNLYMLKKMKENAIDNSILRLDLIAKDENITQSEIKAEVNKRDKGIFAKYEGDPEDTSALQSWFTSLPRGTVILNKDKNGNPVLSSNDVPLGTFVVTDGQGGFLFED